MDNTRFASFYHSQYARLVSLAARILCDDEAARDIVSDAFEYAWIHFDELDEKTLATHLYTIVRSRSVDQLRRRDVHDTYVEFVLTVNDEEDESQSPDRERRAREVHRVLSEMSQRTRQIFIECYVNHLHYAEVAEKLGISQVAVKKSVMQALAAFRREKHRFYSFLLF